MRNRICEERVKELEANLQENFVLYDSAPEQKKLWKIKEILRERSYIRSFLRQLDGVITRKTLYR